MHEHDEANLLDCLYAINHIEEYTCDILSADDLLNDSKTYDAVLMNFVVMAEACNRISTELKTRYPEIAWQGVRRFRNYIAHDYWDGY
ncbi:MAG TPA: HepT-like ribonuclease domain-containing protein [Flavipsychrobacter sp.]|nr:HepT-like ribonuclease domain-containing protein [Flavipsychrobacter sp.]